MTERDSAPLPDPQGEPLATAAGWAFLRSVGHVSLPVLAGGAAVVVVLAFTTQPTMGAQRSVRIRWQQEQRARQAEISSVQADADSAASQAEQTHE